MQETNLNTWKTAIIGEILLFSLLGKILYQELDREWLEELIKEDVFAESPYGSEQAETIKGLELLQRWTNENRNGISDPEYKALRDDALYLFIGVDKLLAPMWASVYFSEKRLVFQEQTLQVREWYARFGLQSKQINREPDDHIGLELNFIAHLATLALQAIDQNDDQTLQTILQAQRDFLSEHLLRWGPVWCKLVKKHASTDFYRGIAHLAHGALLAVAETLQIEMPNEVSI